MAIDFSVAAAEKMWAAQAAQESEIRSDGGKGNHNIIKDAGELNCRALKSLFCFYIAFDVIVPSFVQQHFFFSLGLFWLLTKDTVLLKLH